MKIIKILLLLTIFISVSAYAEDNLLVDTNEDEIISVVGFGDSISYGRGDGYEVGEFVDSPAIPGASEGYLKRVRELAGLATQNASDPGEFFTTDGILRFPSVVVNSSSDIVAILEGTNDTGIGVSSGDYRQELQKAINITKVTGKTPVLFTLLPPCCSRSGREPFTRDYSQMVRYVAGINNIKIADIERAWDSTCSSIASCHLYNIPDGLHPNTAGYDVIGQTFLATLYGIDIFSLEGASKLEEVLGLEEGAVSVIPDEVALVEEGESNE